MVGDMIELHPPLTRMPAGSDESNYGYAAEQPPNRFHGSTFLFDQDAPKRVPEGEADEKRQRCSFHQKLPAKIVKTNSSRPNAKKPAPTPNRSVAPIVMLTIESPNMAGIALSAFIVSRVRHHGVSFLVLGEEFEHQPYGCG